jgi:hypothetical protein
VEVVPGTGAGVGVGGGGIGVAEGLAVGEGGRVAVMRVVGMAVGSSVWTEILHPAARKLKVARSERMCLCTG